MRGRSGGQSHRIQGSVTLLLKFKKMFVSSQLLNTPAGVNDIKILLCGFNMVFSYRIKSLPPYLFAELDKKISQKKKEGADVIDMGVGDPDIPTPRHIIDACCKAANNPENHRYPSYKGMLSFREAVSGRYKRDYGLSLNPEDEVITLAGSKEGIYHIHFALVNPGDIVLCPSPGYPVYITGAMLAGGAPYLMPLLKDNDFLPDLDAIPKDVAKRSKIIWINYPNNPTSAVADKGFYRKLVDFAQENDITVCSDEAYSAIAYDYKPPSFLEVGGARDVGISFDSLSKTYNMTGWRIGYAVGSKKIISGLGRVKTNVDSGVSQIIQEAGISALTSSQDCIKENVKIYRERREALVDGLNDIGLKCQKPKATFYAWVEVPGGDSVTFANRILDKAAVVLTPGIGFGKHGEGYVRFALTQPVDRIKEALGRIEKVL
ncbi:MAG: LL-diaminopimelate aminotransferase, partial [Candidatus Hydrothermarchaeaceae archaeon]